MRDYNEFRQENRGKATYLPLGAPLTTADHA